MRRMHLRSFLLRLAVSICCLAGLSPGRVAAAEPATGRGWFDPAGLVRQFRQRAHDAKPTEFLEMFTAIARGSQMGPGDGWFHGGQSRYGWDWLAARHQVARDAVITAKGFRGPPELFRLLDRDRNGELTADDFDWSERSMYLRQGGMASMLFSMLDANSNGRVSHEEWEAFFRRLGKGKDHLTAQDLRDALTPPAPPRAARGQDRGGGPSQTVLFQGLFRGELGSFFEGPAVGDRTPDFTLPTHDGTRTVRLAQYRGHKPVVLIFGSFT
jgi:AhpC/TSA family/EF hand